MSLLQIKQLKAPEELRKELINITGTQSSTTTTDANFNITDEGIFTCYFGRTVETTDYSQPKEEGEVPSIEITIKVYDDRCKLVSTMPLKATQANIKNNDHICFKLSMSDTNFQQLGGSNIYIFASISSSTVSFKEEYLGNWHDTIKHIFLYDKESAENVYWSSLHHITEIKDLTKKESEITEIKELKKDANIHIKVKGLCGKVVKLYIYTDGLDEAIAEINTNVYRNRKVVTLSPKYLIACYCSKSGEEYKENDNIDLKFKVKVVYEYNDKEGKAKKIEKDSEKLQLTCKMEKVDAFAANGNVYVEVGGSEVAIAEPDRYTDFHIGYICHIEGVGKMVNQYDNAKTNKQKFTVYPFHTYEIKLSDLVKCGLITVEDAIRISTDFSADTTKFNKNNAILSNGKSLIDEIFIDKSSYKSKGLIREIAKKESIRKVLAQIDKTEVYSGNTDMLYICRDAWQVPTDYVEDTSIAEKDRYKKTTTKVTTTIAKDGDNLKQTIKTEVTTQEGKNGTATTTTTEEETIFTTEKEKKGKKNGTKEKTTVVQETHKSPNEKRETDRYNYGHECPFGTYFLNFAPGTYDVKVSWKAIENGNETAVIGVYNADVNNGLPESPNTESRSGIALHQGGANASMGCLTFNISYGSGKCDALDKKIFANKKYLNFICIDERNATRTANATMKVKKITETKTDNKKPKKTKKNEEVTQDDNRYYDLIDQNGTKK